MNKTKGIVVREENIGKLGDIELVMGPEKVPGVLLGKMLMLVLTGNLI